MTVIYSFAPIAGAQASRLILGSMPGKASLAEDQYYAHPRNHFWQIMEEICGIGRALPYEQRCLALAAQGIALWDVLKMCTRSSSLDSDIVSSSIVPNDFATFLQTHAGIRQIFFNGAKAEQVYRRHVLPSLPSAQGTIMLCRLPSTSPANASIAYPDKLSEWRKISG